MSVEDVPVPWLPLARAQSRVAAAGPLLRLEGLRRMFGARVALEGLSLDVQPGEIVGLLGPNGAGKSTAFALLAGLLRPDGGRLQWAGEARGVTDARFRAELGLIFQGGTLDEQLTARENLVLGARLYGMPGRLIPSRVNEMLGLIDLAARADERVKTWSGGMRRRLELARALVHRPRLLLMDEPTQGLDEMAFRTFWEHLRTLRKSEGLTVILTTHRADEAAECDRLAVLQNGKRVALDTPNALSAQVGGDLVLLETSEPDRVAQLLRGSLGLLPQISGGQVRVETPEGHRLIPRLVEALPPGLLKSVQLRRPTLADVFLKLTGNVLAGKE